MPDFCLTCDPECQETMERGIRNDMLFPYFTCPKFAEEKKKLLKGDQYTMSNEEKILAMLTQMQSQLSSLENKFDSLENKVSSIENKVDSLENKVGSLENKVGSLENKVDSLQKDMTEVKTNIKYLWDETIRQDKRIDRIAK